MGLDEKITFACDLISRSLGERPCIAMSFGKDSMVMLSLFQTMGYKLPVVYWKREAGFPKKNRFANEVIEAFDLTVYDFPPLATRFIRKNGKIEVVNYFSTSPEKSIAVPSGIVEPKDGEPYLCSLNDMYHKPRGYCEFPWDTLFIGHKDSDVDPLQGPTPLKYDTVKIEKGPTVCFPLRHFTDGDVWEYSRMFGVMQDTNRYDSGDLTFNNDYYPACTACVNPENASRVWCPKLKKEVANVSAEVQWVESIRPAYWKEV